MAATKLALGKDRLYTAFVIFVFICGVLLMVLPSELLKFSPPERAVLNLDITFSTMSAQGWLSLAFVLGGFLLMVFDLVGADLVMNMVLALCVIFKLITIRNALVGFSSSGLLTILVLMMVAQGFTSTGGTEWIISKLLGTPKDIMLAQIRMCLITLVFSSFVNDTPVYCIMFPIILAWAAKARLPIRQLLIPLSYCALLGGLNTTIGTSTNLVVTGQFDQRVLNPSSEYYQKGAKPIELFGIAPYGIPNGIWGIMYICLAAPFLLPGGAGKKVYTKYVRLFKRGGRSADLLRADDEIGADFFMGLRVQEGSPVVGKTIGEAGLRSLEGQYVTAVRRHGKVSHAVSHEYTLEAGDVLYLSGIPDGIDKLAARFGLAIYSDAVEEIDASQVPGIDAAFGVSTLKVPKADSVIMQGSDSDDEKASGSSSGGGPRRSSVAGGGAHPPELIEATIKKGSGLPGQTIRDCAFRSRFHAAVVAIKRNGLPLTWSGKTIGEEVLQAGDVLLLDVAPQFWTTPAVNDAFSDIIRSGQVRSHTEYMLAMRVSGLLAGKSIEKAGLRQLPNAYLVAVERNGRTIHAVGPDEVLWQGDIAWFAGNAASARFIRNTPGLVPLSEKHSQRLLNTQKVDRRLVQAIVDPLSPLVGQTVREVRFREQFNAAVVAVARKGERIHAKPGDIVLRASDMLLLDTGAHFARAHKDSKYFSIVIEMENTNPPRYLHTAICILSVTVAFVLYAVNIIDILPAGAVVVAVMLLTGCMTPDQARSAIRWDVYLMIAGSFGVSAALEQTGAAAAIANLIVQIGRNLGGSGFTIACIYVATTLLSQIIANNSAAALVFPIAATISKNEGVDIYLLAYAVMLGASSVFMSSFGYQTNLMALASGGHSSRDFLKYGTPMQVVLAVVSVVTLLTNWQMVWLVTGVAGAVVLGLPQVLEWVQLYKGRRAAGPAE